MEYTLSFIFSSALKTVLLLQRNKEPYKNKFNGVGGKIEHRESIRVSALREIKEETGYRSNDFYVFDRIMINSYPSGTVLHIFYGVLKRNVDLIETGRIITEGQLSWQPISAIVRTDNSILAGEGGVAYYVNAAIIDFKTNHKEQKMLKKDITKSKYDRLTDVFAGLPNYYHSNDMTITATPPISHTIQADRNGRIINTDSQYYTYDSTSRGSDLFATGVDLSSVLSNLRIVNGNDNT